MARNNPIMARLRDQKKILQGKKDSLRDQRDSIVAELQKVNDAIAMLQADPTLAQAIADFEELVDI